MCNTRDFQIVLNLFFKSLQNLSKCSALTIIHSMMKNIFVLTILSRQEQEKLRTYSHFIVDLSLICIL